jgi:hypothetical protein
VIVFQFPEHPEQEFIKRVIALPGDKLEAKNGHPFINGWAVPSCYVGIYSYSERRERPYTWDDFVALEEDDLRELIDGELVEVEVPTFSHEKIVGRSCFFLMTWAEAGTAAKPIASGYKVRISDRRGVMPDVQFYRRGNEPCPSDQDSGSSAAVPISSSRSSRPPAALRPREEAQLVRAARRPRVLDRRSRGAHGRAPGASRRQATPSPPRSTTTRRSGRRASMDSRSRSRSCGDSCVSPRTRRPGFAGSMRWETAGAQAPCAEHRRVAAPLHHLEGAMMQVVVIKLTSSDSSFTICARYRAFA